MTQPGASTVTILFTDLVSSTELLQRAGDENAQKIFQAHYRLLRDAVAANGGQEVKTLGDGLMVAFPSAADAVRCAVTMQQTARRRGAPDRLDIRVGLNVGDALRDESDYFGTPVVIARRLCDRAAPGQILCSNLVAGLLSGRQAFSFRDLGPLELKGIAAPIAACEVVFSADEPTAALAHTPFVGRTREVAKLNEKLAEARAGRGGLVMLVGEPGIGKTRTAEEFADAARGQGIRVLWGRCFDGEYAPPYGPFAQAIEEYARSAAPEELRQDLGNGAGAIARLVPELRRRLPDIAEPVALQPDEERFRLLDAVSQFLIAVSARAPVVAVLDDLHWADKGTIAMLRHCARFVTRQRILLLGAYRDVELDRQHPLADALGALRRETEYERVLLRGLEVGDIGRLLQAIAEHDVNQALVDAISVETDGNPFFIREVLIHLVEEGKLYHDGERWQSAATTIAELGIPEGVRQVIGRRLSRLSEAANRLLGAASAFNGVFRFDIAADVAGLEETSALDAVDEALAAQVLKAGIDPDTYDFTHALIRHTLYGEASPSRLVRLHRRVAEAMERGYGAQAVEHAAEIAYQYHESAALPGAERGVDYAVAAADAAEAAYAWDEAVRFLRIALVLLPQGDALRPRVLGQLGIALIWTLQFEEALKVASEAGDLIANRESTDGAADYLADAVDAMTAVGFPRGAWSLAEQGLRFAGDRRDPTWVRLRVADILRREAEDPESLGLAVETAERAELRRVAAALRDAPGLWAELPLVLWELPASRSDVLARRLGTDTILTYMFWAGEYRRCLPLWEELATEQERQGRIAQAVASYAQAARCYTALGEFERARVPYRQSRALASRLSVVSEQLSQLEGARDEVRIATDEDWNGTLAPLEPILRQPEQERNWYRASIWATAARVYARLGRVEEATHWLGELVPTIERAPSNAGNYGRVVCDAATALWWLERTDHIEAIERNIREKVIEPDFRYPMQDGRLSLARLCALQGRCDEAASWFAQARAVLDEQGARPLRAITDFDEAWMYVRRGAEGDRERARPLLEAALRQFREIGMTGWTRRAEDLLAKLAPV